jgi:hypothetical protein
MGFPVHCKCGHTCTSLTQQSASTTLVFQSHYLLDECDVFTQLLWLRSAIERGFPYLSTRIPHLFVYLLLTIARTEHCEFWIKEKCDP